MKFVPSLELSQMLYEQEIQPIMASRFPRLRYAAATLGMCSEVLGLDDEVSMDHEWGPRVRMYLSERDHARYAAEVTSALREELPLKFAGFDMMWRQPGVDVHDTRETILYHVAVGTISDALNFCGGLAALPLPDLDWLRVSEQHLLEFTAGVVYRDDVGELTRARGLLKYYPDNVLRFLLMCEWNAVGGDWFPIGRMGSRGDRLGLRIQAAQAAHRLMRIAFMVCKRYFTYRKWFGTLFKELPLAGALEPILMELLGEQDWRQIEEKIGQAASILLGQQNELGIVPEMKMESERAVDGRHHIQHNFGEIGRQIAGQIRPPLKAVMESQVFWLHDRSLILWNGEVGKWSLLLQR
jgi:hypothetical protein